MKTSKLRGKMDTLLCAAVGTARHQHWVEACTVYGDPTVCSYRHSKPSARVRSMYCVWRPYCVQLQAQQDISVGQKLILCMKTLLCAAVGTASHQRGLEACTVYGDPTVCGCRHSKSSSWVRSMHCVWQIWQFLKNVKALLSRYAQNQVVKYSKVCT